MIVHDRVESVKTSVSISRAEEASSAIGPIGSASAIGLGDKAADSLYSNFLILIQMKNCLPYAFF